MDDDVRLTWPGRDAYWTGDAEAPYVWREPRRRLEQAHREAIVREVLVPTLDAASLGRGQSTTPGDREGVIAEARRRDADRSELEAEIADQEARLERFLARPPVIDERWCVSADRLPADLVERIGRVEGQRRAWETGGPVRIVDTQHLDDALSTAVASEVGEADGELVIGDAFDALRMWQKKWSGQIRMAYVDPPFNTGERTFGYRDRWGSGAWLTLIRDRVECAVPLLTDDGTLYFHIDYNEKERARLLLDEHLHYVTEIIWRIGWISGFKTRANKFIRNHDTIYQFGRSPRPFFRKTWLPHPEGYVRRDGKPAKSPGVPLEDTWNCSEVDRLHSIQIQSFSGEKVGDRSLTQKNEALLKRMIESSSEPGDVVLDFFVGTGTTAAVATKLGRKWLAAEKGEHATTVTVPRLIGVLAGERKGISKAVGWKGGGAMRVLTLGPRNTG